MENTAARKRKQVPEGYLVIRFISHSSCSESAFMRLEPPRGNNTNSFSLLYLRNNCWKVLTSFETEASGFRKERKKFASVASLFETDVDRQHKLDTF